MSRKHLLGGFLEKVRRTFQSKIDPDMSGCWLWKGAKDKNGYGTLRITKEGDTKNWFAHRLSYFLHYGDLDETLNVNHKCDNPACVNPDHLYQGTQADNMRDVKDRKRALGKPKPRLQGNSHPRAVLSEDDVKTIRQFKEDGGCLKDLWLHFYKDKCSYSTITMAARKENWKYV